MFNSRLETPENSFLTLHMGGLPVRQGKRKKLNNKMYFQCTSGSNAVGLIAINPSLKM